MTNLDAAREAAPPILLLASASPRRRDLLRQLGVLFSVVVSRFDEESLGHLTDPEAYVRVAAEGKAAEVGRRRAGWTLGVDTDVVAPDGAILGKPTDVEDACRMLHRLSGQTHRVLTAVCLLRSCEGHLQDRETRVVETRVTFTHLSDAAISAYVATGEPMDKAGGYGIQGRALSFVARIDGDLSSVIGLPLTVVSDLLEQRGIPLWKSGPGFSAAPEASKMGLL